MALKFDWDEQKAIANLRKHKVSFDEGKTVFNDPFAITIDDPDHSFEEERYIDIGRSVRGRVIIVSYTERSDAIRIISCRRATTTEQSKYERQSD